MSRSLAAIPSDDLGQVCLTTDMRSSPPPLHHKKLAVHKACLVYDPRFCPSKGHFMIKGTGLVRNPLSGGKLKLNSYILGWVEASTTRNFPQHLWNLEGTKEMLEKRAVTAGHFKGGSRSDKLWLTSTELFKCQWTDEHNNSRHKLAAATQANYTNAHCQISSRSFSLTTRYLLAFLPWSLWVANFPSCWLAIFQQRAILCGTAHTAI